MAGSAQSGQGKADFGHIYNRPDPRAYFRTLGDLDYEIPQRAIPVFDGLLDTLRARRAAAPRVLDLCCSYGVNAALLRCDVVMDDLFKRYRSPTLDALSPSEVCALDRNYYAERLRPDAVVVSGLDTAANAVGYGCRAGLLDSGWTEDLESTDPSRELAARLGEVDLITSTGGIGYITHRTLDRIMRSGTSPVADYRTLRRVVVGGTSTGETRMRCAKTAGYELRIRGHLSSRPPFPTSCTSSSRAASDHRGWPAVEQEAPRTCCAVGTNVDSPARPTHRLRNGRRSCRRTGGVLTGGQLRSRWPSAGPAALG